MSLNKATVNLVSDMLGAKASPVDLANAAAAANKGDAIDAAVSAANGLQALAGTVSKAVASKAPHVWVAALANDSFKLVKEATEGDKRIKNDTLLGALSTAVAGVGLVAGFTVASPAILLGITAATIVGSAALGLAALAAQPDDASIYDSVVNLLARNQELAAQMGPELEAYFSRYGADLESGIDNFSNWVTGPLPHQLEQRIVSHSNDVLDAIKRQTQTAATIPSPIILDLDGDGLIGTVGLGAGVHFDHAADGFAERTGWVAPRDGLLVWDRNAIGTIDSGRELFGSETLLPNGLKAVNGFEALAALDANGDGVIDANDPVYAQLRVWVDANLDGRTGQGELLTLEEAGVRSISVAYTNSTHVDANGNAHRQVGSYTTTEGHTRLATDVWFQADATYSLPTEWVEVPESIAALPDAQGYGKVRDLHQAMAMDSSGQLQMITSVRTSAITDCP